MVVAAFLEAAGVAAAAFSEAAGVAAAAVAATAMGVAATAAASLAAAGVAPFHFPVTTVQGTYLASNTVAGVGYSTVQYYMRWGCDTKYQQEEGEWD